MSATDAEALRQAQAGIRVLVERDLTAFWASLDLSRPDRVAAAVREYVPALVSQYGQDAGAFAAEWYDAQRLAEGVEGTFRAEALASPYEGAVDPMVRRAVGGIYGGDPAATLATLATNAGKYVLAASRQTIARAADMDPEASGWIRVTRAGACDFCKMLADRGAVYRKASVHFASHGECNCAAVPSWDPSAPEVDVNVYEASKRTSSMTPAQRDRHNARTRAAMDRHAQQAPTAPAATKAGSLPVPEPQFVDRLAQSLESGKVSPAQLAEHAAKASPLGQANAAAAIEKHAASQASTRVRSFASSQDARDWANSHWAGPAGYSDAELAAMRSYTGSGYGAMNSTLRSSKGARTNAQIRAMDSAIERAARVPDNITVVRNTNLRQLGITGSRQDPRTAIGREFVDHGYMSTSINRRGGMQGEVRMEINVPAGSRGVYVSGAGGRKSPDIISDYGGGESELILDRGSRLQVVSVKKVGQRWHVLADLVQEGVTP